MNNQLTSNAEALRLFFTEPIYLVGDENQTAFVEPVNLNEATTSVGINPTPAVVNEVKETIVIATEVPQQSIPIVKKDRQFEYLGKNQKGILILVNDEQNKVSSPQGTELLRKLVKAIELTNNDFALVNYASYNSATFDDLKTFFSCQLVLSFGVEFTKLALAEKPLHLLFETDQVRMIFTKNLHELDSDQMSKKLLWATLQQLKS